MKKLIAFFLISACLPVLGTTWTFHAARDNATSVSIYGPLLSGPNWMAYKWWANANFDFISPYYPVATEVGVWDENTLTASVVDTFDMSDVLVIDVPFYDAAYADCTVFGPYPDYMGDGLVLIPIDGGEFWIDFASDGAARISTIAPIDFGKWSWNGSINPSWVEPLVVKGKKGHRK